MALSDARLRPGKNPWPTALLAVAAIGGSALGYRFFAGGAARTENQTVEAAPHDFVITRSATGEVRPRNRVEVKPPISGRVEEVLVREGDEVKQGAVLAWMSSSERAALLDAARSQGQEQVERWEAIYRAAPLIAPLDGTVIVRAVEPGQTVGTDDAVVVIADHLIVKAQVDETDVGHIHAEQSAKISLDAYPEEAIDGHVEHVAYEAQTVNNVTIYEVDVRPESVPDFMRSGMTANVQIIVAEKAGTLAVPSEAVQQAGKEASVMVRGRNGSRGERRSVEIGISDGKWTEIISGLEPGEKVTVASLKLPKGSQKRNPLSPYGRRPQQSDRPARPDR